jgi:hypothetical protein
MTIALRDVATATTNLASIASQDIMLPSTIQADDLILIASCQRANNATWVTPSGYVLLHSQGTTTTSNSLAVFRKVAVAGDAGATVTMDPSSTAGMATVALVFSGVDTTSPVNASATAADTTANTTGDAPSVTTTVADAMVVTFHTAQRSTTATFGLSAGW